MAAVTAAVQPVEVNQPFSAYPERDGSVGRVQTAEPYETYWVAGEWPDQPLPFHVTRYCLGAEQEAAAAGALEHVHVNDEVQDATAEAVQTEQRFAEGAEADAAPFAEPQAGFCDHWA